MQVSCRAEICIQEVEFRGPHAEPLGCHIVQCEERRHVVFNGLSEIKEGK